MPVRGSRRAEVRLCLTPENPRWRCSWFWLRSGKVALKIGKRSLNSASRRFPHRCSEEDLDCNRNIRRRTFGRRCTCYVSDYGRDSAMRRQLLTGYGACPNADHSTLTLVRIPRDGPRLTSAYGALRPPTCRDLKMMRTQAISPSVHWEDRA